MDDPNKGDSGESGGEFNREKMDVENQNLQSISDEKNEERADGEIKESSVNVDIIQNSVTVDTGQNVNNHNETGKEVHGTILSMKSWVLSPHHNSDNHSQDVIQEESHFNNPYGIRSETQETESDVVYDGKVEICSPNLIAASASLAEANLDARDSETDSFSRVGPNKFETQLRRRRRGKQIGMMVLIGAVGVCACALGVLYAKDEEQLKNNGGSDADAIGIAMSRSRNKSKLACDSARPKCALTGRCLNILGNSSFSHYCDCDPGYHGLQCAEDFCNPNPCVGFEKCVMSSSGIPRCVAPDICNDMANRKDICQNGGQCVPYAIDFGGVKSNFACICQPEFYGIHCADKVSDVKTAAKREHTDVKNNVNVNAGDASIVEVEKKNVAESLNPVEDSEPGSGGPRPEDPVDPGIGVSGGGGGGGGDEEEILEVRTVEDDDAGIAGRTEADKSAVGQETKRSEKNEDDAANVPEIPMDLPCKRFGVDCGNNGTCINLNTLHWQCLCKPEFKGDRCEEKRAPCEVKRCQNQGLCDDKSGRAVCQCVADYWGDACQYRNGCADRPCFGTSECVPFGDGGFTCRCAGGWMGDLCEMEDPCFSSPCHNGGECMIKRYKGVDKSSYECKCNMQEFVGDHCDVVSPCSSKPCRNGGTCEPVEQSGQGIWHKKCYCEWEKNVGENCEIESACVKKPCLNGAKCTSKMDGRRRKCACKTGYQGDNCADYYGKK